MASSSSAVAAAAVHVLLRDKYDVFLSFRGLDTRQTFTEDLYQGLTWKKIDTFIYDRLEVGAEIEYALEAAIEKSKISIIVFSQGYASSRWCLDELVHTEMQEKIWTDCCTCVLRDRSVLIWRDALSAAAALSGYHIQKYSPESAFVYTIVKETWEKLDCISSTKSRDLFGIERQLLHQQIELLLSIQAQDVPVMNTSGAAHVLPRDQYDVFLSFRGSDTRRTFTGDLYQGLTWKNIDTYIDNRLERGDEIECSLEEAIEQSKISIIVFSQDYASSRWCLDELVHILKCKKRYGRIVIPVFYEIDPSVVRKQEKSYADAFVEHEKKFKNNIDKVLIWKDALSAAAGLYGYHIQKYSPESAYVYTIVKEVWEKLNRTLSTKSRDLFGNLSHDQAQHVMKRNEELQQQISTSETPILEANSRTAIATSSSLEIKNQDYRIPTMAMSSAATEQTTSMISNDEHHTPTGGSGASSSPKLLTEENLDRFVEEPESESAAVAVARSTLRNISQSHFSDGILLSKIRESCSTLSRIATKEEEEIIKTLEELLASLPEALNQLKEEEEINLQATRARNDLADQLSAKNQALQKHNLILHQCNADIQSLEVKISALQAQLATKKMEKSNMMQIVEADQRASRELSDSLDQAKMMAKQAENKAKAQREAFEVLCRKIGSLGHKI
ncbi:hypothetical protein ACLB2K_010290 [Fragaria x ananassa]